MTERKLGSPELHQDDSSRVLELGANRLRHFEAGQPILIVAGSGRSLTFSALRAGLAPVVIDGFADADLAAVAEVHRCDFSDFSRQALVISETLSPMPWLYGGGLENEPDLVERISTRHELFGTSPGALRLVRDPWALASILEANAIGRPERVPLDRVARTEGPLIVKPIASVGGLGVRILGPGEEVDDPSVQVQRFISGRRLGAVFCSGAAGFRFLGATEPTAWDQPSISPFLYRGCEGPVALSSEVVEKLGRIGSVVASAFELRGLFGIDFVLRDGQQLLIEVNPRPTASVEILELTLGRSLLSEHLAAFGLGCEAVPGRGSGYARKVVVYAETDLEVPNDWRPELPTGDLWEHRSLLDIPRPGTRIQAGEPVFSMLATGKTREECFLESTWQRHAWFRRDPDAP